MNGTIDIYFSEAMSPIENLTLIEEDFTVINGTEYPILDIKVIPGYGSDQRYFGFTWKV